MQQDEWLSFDDISALRRGGNLTYGLFRGPRGLAPRLEELFTHHALKVKASSARLGGDKIERDYVFDPERLVPQEYGKLISISVEMDTIRARLKHATHGFTEVTGVGVRLWRDDLREGLPGLFKEAPALAIASVSVPVVEQRTASKPSKAGAKPDHERWGQFAAALAVLANNGELDLTSAAKAHKAVGEYLAERGHDVLSDDTVRKSIQRYQTWANGHPYPDEADYSDED